MSTQQSKFSLTEDWTVVVYGFLIIGLSLAGLKIPNLAFGWKDTSELVEKILAPFNFLLVFGVVMLLRYWRRLRSEKVS